MAQPMSISTTAPLPLPGFGGDWRRFISTKKYPEPLPEYCPGFAEVSAFLSMEDEQEGGLYRRFRDLNTRNMLYMQAELDALEVKLYIMDQSDKSTINSGTGAEKVSALRCAVDWSSLAQDEARLKLVMETRKLMKEYNEALLLDAQVAKMPTPSRPYLQIFRQFIRERTMGRLSMRGSQLDSLPRAELLVTHTAPDVDRFSQAVSRTVCNSRVQLFEDRRRVPPSWSNMYFYSDSVIERMVSLVAVVLSVGLLVGGIAALDYVDADRKGVRLGVLAAFTTSFAAVVGLLTNARKTELFVATAGFTAVLVVYVGSA